MTMYQGEKKDKFELLKEAFDALDQINEEFYLKIEMLQEKVEDLKKQASDLDDENKRLQNEKDSILAEMSDSMTAVKTKVDQGFSEVDALSTDIEQISKGVGRIEESQQTVQDLEKREQQVKDAEEKIKAALAAKEKAEKALVDMTQDRDKYKMWWETAKATKKPNPKKDKNGQNQPNAAGVSQNSTVQDLIDKAVMKKSEELEKQHKQDMDTLNAKIDNLTTANESLEAENEELRRQLQDTNQAFDDPANNSDPSYDPYTTDDEDKTQKVVPAQNPGYNFTQTPSDDDEESGGIVGEGTVPPTGNQP